MLRRQIGDVSLLDAEAIARARAQAGSLVTNTSLTTQRKINRIVVDGLAAGDTEQNIALGIQNGLLSDEFLSSRALTIARTESAAAFNYGTFTEYQNNDGVAEKEWLSSRDQFVRDIGSGDSATHTAPEVDGQRRPVGMPFEIPLAIGGSALLQFPSEYGVSAAATINCRCTMIPVVASGLVAA
jgi:uncharacterized protein with gpF-like domain